MNAVAATGRVVRPRFLKWSSVAFALMLPLAAHALWDYVEARRLKTTIDAIRAKGELVSLHGTEPYPLVGGAAEGDRYYRAAAALAAPDPDDWRSRLNPRVADAARSGAWSQELLAEMRARVAGREAALQLLDRASRLPFEGFSAGTSYSYRTSQLVDLLALGGLRTLLLALDGDGDRAADSLYAQIRLQRAIEHSGPVSFPWSLRFTPHVSVLAEWTRPSPGALSRLAHSLAEIDDDDLLKRQLIRRRAFTLDHMFANFLPYYAGLPRYHNVDVREVVRRPWVAHRFNQGLETFAAVIEAAKQPWPTRIDAVGGVPVRPTIPQNRVFGLPVAHEADMTAERISLLRCARVVVAVKRYQLEHAERLPGGLDDLVPAYLESTLVDPFSGRPLRFIAEEASYVVYSIGPNRRDDGGRVTQLGVAGTNPENRPESLGNLGMRIRMQAGPR